MAEEDQDQQQTLAVADEAAAHASEENQIQSSLSLKLKIPTKATDQFMEAEEDLPRVLRTCSECGKQFTSGKAMGGHKRACLQKIKNHNSGNTNQKPKIKTVVAVKLDGDNNINNDQESNNICYVCHQSFRSVKSLYGHMRKHPEREWRGVQPPKLLLMNHHHQSASAAANGGGGGGGDGDGDLVESLKGWSAKRKRGQRLVMYDQDEEEAMQQAVNDLLLLAQLSDNKNSSVGSGYGVLKIKEKRVIDDDNEEDQDDWEKKVNIYEMKGDDGLGFDDCNSVDTWIVKEEPMVNNKVQKKNNKKRRLNELEDAVKGEPMVTQTFSCPICNKAFDKHQALGGHIASHNKNKIAAEDTKAEQVAAAAADEETGESSRVAAAGSSEHKCNICNKTFPTGQALGGHKRCHWTGPAEAFSSSSQVTTSAGEVTQRTPRVVHDFDLNDTPPEYYQFHGIEAAATAAAATVS